MNSRRSLTLWALAAFVIAALPIALLDDIQSHLQFWLYKMVLGMALGVVLASAYSTFRSTVYALRTAGLSRFEKKRPDAVFHILALLIYSLVGLVICIANWEGHDTGVFYAIGIFIGDAVAGRGLVPLIESRYRSPNRLKYDC